MIYHPAIDQREKCHDDTEVFEGFDNRNDFELQQSWGMYLIFYPPVCTKRPNARRKRKCVFSVQRLTLFLSLRIVESDLSFCQWWKTSCSFCVTLCLLFSSGSQLLFVCCQRSLAKNSAGVNLAGTTDDVLGSSALPAYLCRWHSHSSNSTTPRAH